MFISINAHSSQPIYLQIAEQIKFAIANHAICDNEMIPSVRELAKELAINPNTVSNAYRELQDSGLIHPRRGIGFAVSQGALQHCQNERLQLFERRFRQLLKEAEQSGLTRDAIQTLLNSLM
ncbi:MAG: GntR family transcriptional regulator [Thermoguttaceae bacterium]